MSKSKTLVFALGMLAASFLGGAASHYILFAGSPANAQDAEAAPKVIRANQFIVEDEKGKTRALLSVNKGVPGLSLTDEKGNLRVVLSVVNGVPGLGLYDEKGKAGVDISVVKAGPCLSMSDEKGNMRAMLGVVKAGPGLSLADVKGKVFWSTPAR